jgi:hypothetical protein
LVARVFSSRRGKAIPKRKNYQNFQPEGIVRMRSVFSQSDTPTQSKNQDLMAQLTSLFDAFGNFPDSDLQGQSAGIFLSAQISVAVLVGSLASSWWWQPTRPISATALFCQSPSGTLPSVLRAE